MKMSNRDVAAFASAWSNLTDKQKNFLLSQLNSFVSQNSKCVEKSRPNLIAGSRSIPKTSRAVTRAKRKNEKHGLRTSLRKDPLVYDVEEVPSFKSKTANHHSPAKVGSDGVAIYGRTLISQRALQTLQQMALDKTSPGMDSTGTQSIKPRIGLARSRS